MSFLLISHFLIVYIAHALIQTHLIYQPYITNSYVSRTSARLWSGRYWFGIRNMTINSIKWQKIRNKSAVHGRKQRARI